MLELDEARIAHKPASNAWQGQSLWSELCQGLKRRPHARLALLALLLLHSVAIFAPLIANDRPLWLVAARPGEYERQVRSLSAVLDSIERILHRSENASKTYDGTEAQALDAAAIQAELHLLAQRKQAIADWLRPADQPPLEAWWLRVERLAAALGGGDVSMALVELDAARASAIELRTLLAPMGANAGGGEGRVLRRRASSPLLSALSGWDLAAMLAWLYFLAFPARALMRGHASQKPRLGSKLSLLALLATCLGLGLGVTPARAELDGRTSHKVALAQEELSARVVLFTLLPYGFAESNLDEALRPPSWYARAGAPAELRAKAGEPAVHSPWRHLAGTDALGRDLLTRILWGARTSLAVGLLSALLASTIGLIVGAIAGYSGGLVDACVLRVLEVLQALPALFLVLLAMAFADPRVLPPVVTITALIALLRWPAAARLARGEFLRLKDREYVLAARALGLPTWRILLRHILPNAWSPLFVHLSFAVSGGILTESAISFLGLGVQPPRASWGALIQQSKDPSHWWIHLFPGLCILLVVSCYNILGDALRATLDPKQRGGM